MTIAFLAVAALITVTVMALTGKAQAQSAASSATPSPVSGDVVTVNDAISNAAPLGNDTSGNISVDTTDWEKHITTDESTWPSGDAIWDICRAIAKAEGYDVAGKAPFRLNNPGDLSDGAHVYGVEFHDGSNITCFPDAATGWNWLYNKIHNHVTGKSTVYPASWTIDQVSRKYAGSWQNWQTIVSNELNVSVSSTFAQYVAANT
jgi:hypothetical protein